MNLPSPCTVFFFVLEQASSLGYQAREKTLTPTEKFGLQTIAELLFLATIAFTSAR